MTKEKIKNIFNLLQCNPKHNKKEGVLPKQLKTIFNVNVARSLFIKLNKGESVKTFITEVADFYKQNGAVVKLDNDCINYEIKF